MEQAVNTFNKGLQSDTHPMVQGNDTLSDALNATFVTMNGNEVILQNDMGNRRVDNAYLPSGYEPVGMKEYGGIIYVAAYNPITNKSQIGSFPSPERKISSEDGSGLGGSLNLNELTKSYSDSNLNGLPCIYKDVILVPLTKDTSLHAGDKFVVYGTLDNTRNITNYKNTTGNKVVSPKNKKYTLALGILNSQNEFVDITKTLVRWNNNKMIDYEGTNYSDLYKFNNGYFIASSFSNPTFEETLSDAQLIQERQTIATNTYAYKLVGPLYIKATLNHIKDFSYNIYGISTNEKKTEGTIWIEAFITYNCPDGITTGEGSDDNYSTYAEGKPTFGVFDLYGNNNSKIEGTIVSEEKTKYDPNTDLYTYKIVKTFNVEKNKDTNIFEYVIGVKAVDNEDLYLSGLSTKGELDLSLLGSGEVKIKGWRFINDYNGQSGTITYNFDAYPKYGTSFQDFQFNFKDVNDATDTEGKNIPASLYNGRNTLNIDWKALGLNPNKLYRVTWRYDIVEENGIRKTKESINNSDDKQKDRWYLTTELFNECYSPNNGDYIHDYGNPTGNINDTVETNSEEGIMKRKESIPYEFNPNVSDKSLVPTLSTSGNVISNTSNIELIYTTQKRIVLSLNPSITFNENLYPDYIKIKDTALSQIKLNSIKGECEDEMPYIPAGLNVSEATTSGYEPKFTVDSGLEGLGKKVISGVLFNYDYYKSIGTQSGNINNGFTGVDKLLEDIASTTDKYSMVFIDWDRRNGHRDDHYLRVDINNNNQYTNKQGENGIAHDPTMTTIGSAHTDGRVDFTMKEYKSKIFDEFKSISPEFLFTWAFYGPDDIVRLSSEKTRGSGDLGNQNARVWWRTSYGDWALFPNHMTRDKGITSFLKDFFKTKFKFAYYKNNISLSQIGKYRPDPTKCYYSDRYSFIYTISWKMSIDKDKILNIGNISGINCRYPEFIVNEQNASDLSYDFNISGSEDFQDLLDLIPTLVNIDGIDVDTGKTTDSLGKALNPNNLYKYDPSNPSELTYWGTSDLVVSEQFGKSGTRGIVYNRQITGSPSKPYDVGGGSSDSHTVLIYDDVNIVRGCT